MAAIPLMVVEDEIVEIELSTGFRSNPPIEEGAERITLHEAIKKAINLLRSPHKLPLNCRQNKIMPVDFVEGILYGFSCLIHWLPSLQT